MIYGKKKGRTEYTVTVPKKLKDRFGQSLSGLYQTSFKVGPSPSGLIGPKNEMIVLDPWGTQTIPFYTVNKDAVRLRIHAVSPADYLALAALTKAKRSQQVNGNPSPPGGVAPFEAMEAKARLALTSAADLVAEFDQALDVIVSVARKTDADQRKALFEACGNPGDLFTVALHTNRLRTAGCYLLVVSELDGAAAGRRAAEELLHKTLEAGGYDFALEIVRFLLRAGREEDLEAEELARGRDGTHTEASGDSSNGTRAPKQRTWWGWFMGEPAPAAATARRRPLQGPQRQKVTEAAARVSEGAVHRAVRLAVERHWQAAAARAQQRAREATPSANGSGEPDARAAAEARAFRDEALELLDESSVRG